MSETEPTGGIWNTDSLFYGDTPAPAPAPWPPPPASPPPSSSPPPEATTEAFYQPPPWAAPPPPSYPAQPFDPPPPSYPPPAPAPAPRGGVRRSVVVGAAVAAVVTVLAVVAVFAVIGNRGEPEAETVSFVNSPGPAATTTPTADPTTAATPSPVTESPEPQPSTESTPDALAQLQTLSLEGLAQVTLNGQYAAQIASKYPGIDDPLQTNAAGSHIFTAADILAEHVGLRDAHRSAEHPVILLKSTDYGKRQLIGTHFLWVTFAIGDFPDKQSVHDWCDAQFADLGEQQRANQCVARRLDPGR